MQEKILVLGGTGLLGKPVTLSLQKTGYQLRLMVRNIEKARASVESSIELVPGDVTDLGALEKAMTGCHGVHISVGGSVDQLSAENVSNLAPKLGVKRITYISGATVCEDNRWFPMVAQKLNAEKAICESGVNYTIFCPTWPMEMLVRFAREGQPFMMGKQPNPIHWYAVDELGRMVAIAYQKETAVNKRFYIHGPEGIPMKEALERYCRVFHPGGKPVSVMPIWLAKLIAGLTGNKGLKFAAGLMGYFDKIGELGDPTTANQILSAPNVTFDAWMMQHQTNTGKEV